MATQWLEVGDTALAFEHRPGPGPLVVFLHAGVADRRCWWDVTPDGVATLTWDRRGFGESELRGTGFTHLGDLRALLDAVSGDPVLLVGNSLGGGLALDAALLFPDRVAGLLLLSPAVSGSPSPALEDLEPRTLELDAAVDAAVAAGDLGRAARCEAELWLDGPLADPGRVGGATRELFLAMDGIALRNHAAEHGDAGLDAWSRLAELDLPVTLACGDLDARYLQVRTAQLLELVPGAERVDLPGTAHLPSVERPDLVAGLVVDLVERAARRPRTDGALEVKSTRGVL